MNEYCVNVLSASEWAGMCEVVQKSKDFEGFSFDVRINSPIVGYTLSGVFHSWVFHGGEWHRI